MNGLQTVRFIHSATNWNPEGSAMLLALILVGFTWWMIYRRGRKERVYPVIVGMAHGNPAYRCTQQEALKIAQGALGTNTVRPVLERLYGNTCIGSRYFAIPDFTPEQQAKGDKMFFPGDGSYDLPIHVRLKKFRETATPLVLDIAGRAMREAGIEASQIAKLVVVSSTGFLGPGLDCDIIKGLGLSTSVDRSLIGFMGCAAAMNGFRVANDYVKAHKGEYALMLCVKISSVHTNFDDCVNNSIIHAIFGDGCAACVLSGETKATIAPGTLVVLDEYGLLMDNTDDGIVLSINSNGISCTLSKHLPSYISKGIRQFVDKWLHRKGYNRFDVDFWAIHPGGKRIIESVTDGLQLTEKQAADSWAVLYEYGNMLSPSVMYVLTRVFKRHQAARAEGQKGYNLGVAFSFSPGIGVEGIMLGQIH